MIEPQVIRDRMEALEKTPDRDRDVLTAAREILGVPEADHERFASSLGGELWRTQVLCRTHYAKSVAVLPSERVMLAAMLQGITFAAAVLEPRLEDADDAGEASTQAAFWRQRAIELGADEAEYRNSIGRPMPPLLGVLYHELKLRGWTTDGAGFVDPEGNQHATVDAAVLAQSLREIGAS